MRLMAVRTRTETETVTKYGDGTHCHAKGNRSICDGDERSGSLGIFHILWIPPPDRRHFSPWAIRRISTLERAALSSSPRCC
jgi:hypothetical protein